MAVVSNVTLFFADITINPLNQIGGESASITLQDIQMFVKGGYKNLQIPGAVDLRKCYNRHMQHFKFKMNEEIIVWTGKRIYKK